MKRLMVVLAVTFSGCLGIAARCIENVAVYTPGDGYTYLAGEIFNDTEVHGTQIVVQATLFDAQNNVIASQNVDVMCPADLPPHGQSAYAVRFNQKNLPAHARFEVRPVSGVTLESPLPAPPVTFTQANAEFSGEPGGVIVRVAAHNTGPSTIDNPQLCAATYDSAGKVRSVSPIDPKLFHADTTLNPGQARTLDFTLRGQQGAATARVWLVVPGAASGTYAYRSIMSAALPIAP